MLEDMTRCDACGSTRLTYESPEYAEGRMAETIQCRECGAAYIQQWTLKTRRQVRPGSQPTAPIER